MNACFWFEVIEQCEVKMIQLTVKKKKKKCYQSWPHFYAAQWVGNVEIEGLVQAPSGWTIDASVTPYFCPHGGSICQ